MSGTATIAITVGVAVAVLVGFFIVYYLGNVANSIYDVKVGVRKDFEKKVKELQEWVDKDTKQRINWMRDENKEDQKRFKDSMEGHIEETFNEMQKAIERLRADVTSLQLKVDGGKDRQQNGHFNEAPPLKRPERKTENVKNDPGSLVVPKVGLDDSEVAPDMAVPKQGMAADDGAPGAPSMMAKEGEKPAIKTEPTPPPPPSPKPKANQPAGRASLEEKAKQKKKKRNPDEFESFNNFSNDFKAGS